MPQVGTLLVANHLFQSNLRIFRIESFNNDWKKMLQETGLEYCMHNCPVNRTDAYNQWILHGCRESQSVLLRGASVSSATHYNSANRTAIGNNDTRHYSLGLSQNFSGSIFSSHVSSTDPLGTTAMAKAYLSGGKNMTAKSRAYLRVLCRIYFPDFLCFGYSLPSECRDIYKEVNTFFIRRRCGKKL